MKAIIILSIMFAFTGNLIISQPVNYENGGRYLKTVEYNVIHPGVTEDDYMYNLKHKSIIDRLFFGTKNSFMEFVFIDSSEGSNQSVTFRIIQNLENDSYKLEVMCLEDMLKVYDIRRTLLEKTTTISLPFWVSKVLPKETEEQIKNHNKQAAIFKYNDELYKPYRPEPLNFQICKELAEKLHEKTSILIENFKGAGIPLDINDGFEVTFRCVIDNELWTLSIHYPQGKALQFSNLFREIITDGFDNKLDQDKYIEILDNIL